MAGSTRAQAVDHRSPQLAVLGHILEEVIRFPDHEVGPVLGGPAAYASVASSRLGTDTGLVTFVSAPAPDFLVSPLRDAGVRLDGLRRGAVTRRTLLAYDERGNKSITYLATPPSIGSADVPASYWKAAAFLICPMDFEVADDVVRRAKVSGGLVMIDLGGYGGTVATVHPVDDAAVADRVRWAVAGTDIVKASFEDCRYLFGPSLSPTDCLHRLFDWGARISIVTMGEDGAILLEDDDPEVRVIRAFPATVVDVTGAGDVFCGAFAAEFLRSRNAIDSAIYGCAAAALAIEHTGGTSVTRMPTDGVVRSLISTVSGLA